MVKWIAVLIVFCLYPLYLSSQEAGSQFVYGVITDIESGQPVGGAQFVISRRGVLEVTYTDSLGHFRTRPVYPGPANCRISAIGYDTLYLPNEKISTGKALGLDIQLSPRLYTLSEATVRSSAFSGDLITQMNIIKPGEGEKMAATFYDPVRMARLQSGAVILNDQANEISLFGLPPDFNSWRLEGMEIISPNHLRNAGTFTDKPGLTGGGVNILSHQMLDHSQFITGATPIEYGNALGGIMDMQLRKGNPYKAEHRAKASLLGLEFATEGPVPVGSAASYLGNFRYSTVGLLSAIGVDFGDEEIRFFDGSAHIHLPLRRGRTTIQLFGTAGQSENNFFRKEDLTEVEEEKDLSNILYSDDYVQAGLTMKHLLGRDGILQLGFSFSGTSISRDEVSFDSLITMNRITDLFIDHEKFHLSGSVQFSLFPEGIVHAGISHIVDHLELNQFDNQPLFNTYWSYYAPKQSRPFIDFQYDPKGPFRLELGLETPFTELDDIVIAPSATLGYLPTKNLQFEFSYRKMTQLPQPWLFPTNSDADTNNIQAIYGLNSPDFIISDQFSLRAGVGITPHLQAVTQLFLKKFSELPVTNDNPGFSAFQQLSPPAIYRFAPNGVAQNYGVQQQFRLQTENLWTGQLALTYYKSQYATEEGGVWLPAQFDHGLSTTGFIGRNFTKEKEKGLRTIGFSLACIYHGGTGEAPILLDESRQAGETVFDYSEGFKEKLDNYFRIDLQLFVQKDRARTSSRLSIDIQNLLNTENAAYNYYDAFLGSAVTKNQLGIIPLLSYQLDF